MFEVGFTEIVLILGLALLVLGPEKLPGLAQKVGRWTGRARSMARQLRNQLEQEVTLDEMTKSRPMQPGSAEPSPEPSTPPAASTADDSTAEYGTGSPEESSHPDLHAQSYSDSHSEPPSGAEPHNAVSDSEPPASAEPTTTEPVITKNGQ